ncbi:hypothetical protein [Oceanobacillus bengalensis]|uniref:DUF4025 domain-containing protein n=1 Tax=Oceanobacillus bengalensis TaxID=1435466 RepID=A0A494YX01_9BACI|nr:hypothetical protein [Oceanobacillus bengalensis]RKQ14640.1 hypothetical protein D8M05_12425 [Oceanobacillus bengalensis]
MAKKNSIKDKIPKSRLQLYEDKDGVQAVQNQLFESYQSGVVEDELNNNIGVHHFNNRKN